MCTKKNREKNDGNQEKKTAFSTKNKQTNKQASKQKEKSS